MSYQPMFRTGWPLKRRRRRGPVGSGRTRIKLALLLSEALGTPVYPEDIWEQNHHPSFGGEGCSRWGWKWRVPGQSWPNQGACWDRMGTCVRRGFTLHDEDGITVAEARGEA